MSKKGKKSKKASSDDWKKLAQTIKTDAAITDRGIKRLRISGIILSSATIVFQLLLIIVSLIKYPYFSFSPATPAELNSGATSMFLLESLIIVYVIWSFIFTKKLKKVDDFKKAQALLGPAISCFLNWVIITFFEAFVAFLFFYNGFGMVNIIAIVAVCLEIASFILSMRQTWSKKHGDKVIKAVRKALLGAAFFHLFAPLAFFAYTFIMVFVFYS